MKYETKENLDKVYDILGEEELLCQLAEECNELGKAALKLRRTMNGKNVTPVTHEEAEANFLEEIADVQGVLTALGIHEFEYEDTIERKAKRWIKRLTKNKN